MRNPILICAVAVMLCGCSFKGEINDNRGDEAPVPTGGPEKDGEIKDPVEVEGKSSSLSVYVFNQAQGTEDLRNYQVETSEEEGHFLKEPIFIPPEESNLRLKIEGNEFERIDAAFLENVDHAQVGGLQQLKGTDPSLLEYDLEAQTIANSGARYLSVLADAESVIGSEVFQSPTDLEITLISPSSIDGRNGDRDIHEESGSYFILHQLTLKNPHPYSVKVTLPTVITGQYMVRRFEDLFTPNEPARNIDRHNCGGAVQQYRNFTEHNLSKVGLFFIPESKRVEGHVSQYVGQSNHLHEIPSGGSFELNVYVKGRSDIEALSSIFQPTISRQQSVVTGCVQKKTWFDPDRGRHDSGKFGNEEPYMPLGRWIYHGEAQHSNLTVQSGNSRVFLNLFLDNNKPFTIYPASTKNYQGSMFERVPASLGHQRLLFTRGIE